MLMTLVVLLAVLAVAIAAVALRARASGPRALVARLKPLRAAHRAMALQAADLDATSEPGRRRKGDRQAAYRQVSTAAQGAIAALGAFGEELAAIDAAFKRREPVAAQRVADLERERDRLAVVLRAIAEALQQLEAGGLSAEQVHQAGRLPERALAVQLRLTAAWRRWAQEGVRASGHGLEEDYPALEAEARSALVEAEGFLGRSPLELGRAEWSVERAEKSLDAYARELSEEIERERRRQADGPSSRPAPS